MLLAVDVGNTQTHLGVFRGAELVCKWRISTDARRTADELALTFRELLSLGGIDLGDDVSAVVIASVVPSATGALKGMVRGCLSIDPLVVGPGTRTGMAVATDNPREVGADRIA
ncbi:MAG: type III pantothenate kinase, partial [Actinomycetota bacterium]